MNRFIVTIRTLTGRLSYTAIALCSCDVIADAIDLFGVCGVSAKPQGKQQ